MACIPGNQPPNPLLGQYYTLQAAIASGVQEVRFQDRTVRYASIDDMIKAANWLYQKLAAEGLLPGVSGVNRQIRTYTNKGL